MRFAVPHGLSVHHAAALAIARRGLQLSERLPRSPVRIPDGRGRHVTVSPVENMGQMHVWRLWARQAKAVNAALAAHLLCRNGTNRATGHTPEPGQDSVAADFQAYLEAVTQQGNPGETPGRKPELPIPGRLRPPSGLSAPAQTHHASTPTDPARW